MAYKLRNDIVRKYYTVLKATLKFSDCLENDSLHDNSWANHSAQCVYSLGDSSPELRCQFPINYYVSLFEVGSNHLRGWC